jgi:enoyl-CoA hydratase/carnithine racemase
VRPALRSRIRFHMIDLQAHSETLPEYQTLSIRRDGPVDHVLLNRPDHLNALSLLALDELNDYFGRQQFNEASRIVVMRGAGRAFCAGLDIRDFDPSAKRTVEEVLLHQRKLAETVLRMHRCPQVVIALVNGAAVGAGFALALAADIRIAGPRAKMNAAFIKIGASACDVGVSYFLPRLVGASVARELMLTGRFIDAERALRVGLVSGVVLDAERSLRVGLVSDVVPEDELDAAGEALVDEMHATSPMGLRLTKECLNATIDSPSLEVAIAMENRNQILCGANGDIEEGMNAFLEKRPPVYGKRDR